MRELNSYTDFNSFKEENKEALHIIKLGAEWCGPCKQMSNIISNLDKTKIGNTMFAEVDIENENNENIVSEFNVRSIPVLLFIKDGKLLEKKVGSLSTDMLYKTIESYK